jgi:hypothetical protein
MDTERAVPQPQPTGDSRVDDAIAGLAGLSDLPLDEHPAVLEDVHDRLREILGELGPVSPAGTVTPRPPRGAGPDGAWQQGQLGQQERPGGQGQYGQQRR